MNDQTRFPDRPERRYAEALGAHFEGPDAKGFLARLGGVLRGLPERDSEWDVLAAWARPRVLAAAMVAGFLLGMAMWRTWRSRGLAPTSAVSVAMLEAIRPPEVNPVVNVVLEER
jgi:hypothetical protein